ncbi:hypothetical protein GQX74_005497 [Glossina fuscipes]|nr:hypothetical protein GQX74_005497 [Glossina fuscipes]
MYYTHISQSKEYLEERNVSKMDQVKENVTARVFPLSDNVTKYYGAVFYVACTKRNGYMECFVVEECKKIWPEMGGSPILNENYLLHSNKRRFISGSKRSKELRNKR